MKQASCSKCGKLNPLMSTEINYRGCKFWVKDHYDCPVCCTKHYVDCLNFYFQEKLLKLQKGKIAVDWWIFMAILHQPQCEESFLGICDALVKLGILSLEPKGNWVIIGVGFSKIVNQTFYFPSQILYFCHQSDAQKYAKVLGHDGGRCYQILQFAK